MQRKLKDGFITAEMAVNWQPLDTSFRHKKRH